MDVCPAIDPFSTKAVPLAQTLPVTWPGIGWVTCPNSPLQSWDQQTGGCPEHPWKHSRKKFLSRQLEDFCPWAPKDF